MDWTNRRSFTRIGNSVRIWGLGEGFTLIVGLNESAIFLEVGYVDGEGAHVIVHAMRAREKFLR